MNRDASARLTMSSALEAHKSQCLVFDIFGVDVGFENPVFACIELMVIMIIDLVKFKKDKLTPSI